MLYFPRKNIQWGGCERTGVAAVPTPGSGQGRAAGVAGLRGPAVPRRGSGPGSPVAAGAAPRLGRWGRAQPPASGAAGAVSRLALSRQHRPSSSSSTRARAGARRAGAQSQRPQKARGRCHAVRHSVWPDNFGYLITMRELSHV